MNGRAQTRRRRRRCINGEGECRIWNWLLAMEMAIFSLPVHRRFDFGRLLLCESVDIFSCPSSSTCTTSADGCSGWMHFFVQFFFPFAQFCTLWLFHLFLFANRLHYVRSSCDISQTVKMKRFSTSSTFILNCTFEANAKLPKQTQKTRKIELQSLTWHRKRRIFN